MKTLSSPFNVPKFRWSITSTTCHSPHYVALLFVTLQCHCLSITLQCSHLSITLQCPVCYYCCLLLYSDSGSFLWDMLWPFNVVSVSLFLFFIFYNCRYFQGIPDAVSESDQRGGCACWIYWSNSLLMLGCFKFQFLYSWFIASVLYSLYTKLLL